MPAAKTPAVAKPGGADADCEDAGSAEAGSENAGGERSCRVIAQDELVGVRVSVKAEPENHETAATATGTRGTIQRTPAMASRRGCDSLVRRWCALTFPADIFNACS